MNESEKYLTIKRYLTLTAVILFLLVMMFFILDLERFIRVSETKSEDATVFLATSEPIDLMSLSDLADDVLLIEGKELKSQQDLVEMDRFIEEKKAVIFLSLPTQDFIEEHELSDVLGINQMKGEKTQKELNLVAGFMLGGFYQFEDLEYEAIDFDLAFSTKVYGYGQKTPTSEWPIIWRNTYEGSEIYSVNGPFMATGASHGILTALLSEIHEDHLYPVVNARLMVYENFPYLSYENKEQLEEHYNRDAMKLQHDILLPDLLSINKLRGFIPNGFFSSGFKESAMTQVQPHDKRQLITYKEQIFKDGGEVGLSYSGDIEQDRKDYLELFSGAPARSLLIDEETAKIEDVLQGIPSVEVVLGPFQTEKNFTYLNEKAVYLPFTSEGFEQSGQEELEFISMVTAFGAIVQNMDLAEVLQPEDGGEKWTGGQKEYVSFLDKHREKFAFLKNRNILETADALKILLNNAPEITKRTDEIKLTFSTNQRESSYILRTSKKIKNVENGNFKKIEEDAYLITAQSKEVRILLNE